MKLTTQRLSIRPFEESDFKDLYSIYQNKEICRYLLHEPWEDHDALEHFQKKLENNQLTEKNSLSLAVLYEGKVVGDINTFYTDMKDTVEIGYTFHPESTGKGLATEAVRELIEWLFYEKDIHRIQANIDARNTSSAKLCERVGLRKEAHFLQDFWNKDEWTDSLVYGMLRKDL
ncbi:GNAT family N-acetyltransferase [Marinilactibacillus psychrotolerans]|uniref:GNAT family N-acetyltransferase n=1 Tax=Marinilactibacillus psychrotolerans TaxID=191770 RepID=UPI00388764A2